MKIITNIGQMMLWGNLVIENLSKLADQKYKIDTSLRPMGKDIW